MISPKNWFRQNNIIWQHDIRFDQIETDRRGKSRVIKRYIGHNKGRNYNDKEAIAWLNNQAVKAGVNGVFTVNTET